jgi:hypothetical protein
MADVNISAVINRDLLGLLPLELADGNPYLLSSQFLGAAVTWDRQTVGSRWVDGDYTVSRRRANVSEQIAIEVVADNMLDLRTAMMTLINAFTQDHFTLTVTVDGVVFAYDCEAGDYTNAMWNTPRLAASRGQVVFTVPRRPIAAAGV